MARVNNSAPQDQFVTEGGHIAGPNETPILEVKIPGMDMWLRQHPHDEVGKGAKVVNGEGEGMSGGEVYAKMDSEVRTVKEDVGEKVEQGGVQNGSVEGETKKNGLMDKMRGVWVSHLLRLLKQH